MIAVFVLLERPDTWIFQKVFDFVDHMPYEKLSRLTLEPEKLNMMPRLRNLSCSAARRCIDLLMRDCSPKSAAIALKILSLILPECKLSLELNDACRPARPFGYWAATGDHGLSSLILSAYTAMQKYRKRYEERSLEVELLVEPTFLDTVQRRLKMGCLAAEYGLP